MTPEQPASDTVVGLQTMLVDRYREALREAVALLDKRRHPRFAESCATPGCGCPVCAFVSRPDVLRLLAGESEPVPEPEPCICGGGGAGPRLDIVCPFHDGVVVIAQTCVECGGSGEVTVQTYLSGVRASIPCPACRPAQTEAGAE